MSVQEDLLRKTGESATIRCPAIKEEALFSHRYPIGDIKPHDESLDCPCNPILLETEHGEVAHHQSFDHREIVIQAEIVLGIRCADCWSYLDKHGHHTDDPPGPYNENL